MGFIYCFPCFRSLPSLDGASGTWGLNKRELHSRDSRMAPFHNPHLCVCGASRLTLSAPNKRTASRPKPRLQCTQNQTHPPNARAPAPSRGRAAQTSDGVSAEGRGEGWPPPRGPGTPRRSFSMNVPVAASELQKCLKRSVLYTE